MIYIVYDPQRMSIKITIIDVHKNYKKKQHAILVQISKMIWSRLNIYMYITV